MTAGRERDALGVAELSYGPDGLIPAIVQEVGTGCVLMMAWMNEEALSRTLETRRTWFWSRSRERFWMKGEESGNVQEVVDLRYDCDADALLVLVHVAGPACHTGEHSCFYRSLMPAVEDDGVSLSDLLIKE